MISYQYKDIRIKPITEDGAHTLNRGQTYLFSQNPDHLTYLK